MHTHKAYIYIYAHATHSANKLLYHGIICYIPAEKNDGGKNYSEQKNRSAYFQTNVEKQMLLMALN